MLYLDTSCRVELYDPDPDSIAEAKAASGKPIIFTDLHELEISTAMQLKLFREEVSREQVTAAMNLVREDLAAGKLSRGSLGLHSAMRRVVTMALENAALLIFCIVLWPRRQSLKLFCQPTCANLK